ncbi:MAG TPA: ABC transporter permease subunit [Candidatus Omnitrophica bacterium]|nr:ABC transporter permease subunit [Candidatus Omnitrophota bacterium]
MEYILNGINDAFRMIFSLNAEVLSAVSVSLMVSTVAIFLAILLGLPLGFIIGTNSFFGKKTIITIMNTLLAVPTVFIGLMVYSFICRRGLLGNFGLLYTPWAMIIGQTILAFPIVSALTLSAVSSIDRRIEKTALSLGANKRQVAVCILTEARFAIFSAIIVAFGRVFSEVGISMLLGGNIRYLTRNITTTIVLETGKGEFALGIALGIVLLTVALLINIVFSYLQSKKSS